MPPALRLVRTPPARSPVHRDDLREDTPEDLNDDLSDDGDAPVTVPVRRGASDVVRVPAVLLLSAAGRCSCDDCCRELARRKERTRLTRVG